LKAVVVITDSEAMLAFERRFLEDGQRGFTIIPTSMGRGKTGLKAGDRVHPGASSLLFTMVEDGEVDETLSFLKRVREAARAEQVTKIYVAAAEEVR
jgi:hypothetical protein